MSVWDGRPVHYVIQDALTAPEGRIVGDIVDAGSVPRAEKKPANEAAPMAWYLDQLGDA